MKNKMKKFFFKNKKKVFVISGIVLVSLLIITSGFSDDEEETYNAPTIKEVVYDFSDDVKKKTVLKTKNNTATNLNLQKNQTTVTKTGNTKPTQRMLVLQKTDKSTDNPFLPRYLKENMKRAVDEILIEAKGNWERDKEIKSKSKIKKNVKSKSNTKKLTILADKKKKVKKKKVKKYPDFRKLLPSTLYAKSFMSIKSDDKNKENVKLILKTGEALSVGSKYKTAKVVSIKSKSVIFEGKVKNKKIKVTIPIIIRLGSL